MADEHRDKLQFKLKMKPKRPRNFIPALFEVEEQDKEDEREYITEYCQEAVTDSQSVAVSGKLKNKDGNKFAAELKRKDDNDVVANELKNKDDNDEDHESWDEFISPNCEEYMGPGCSSTMFDEFNDLFTGYDYLYYQHQRHLETESDTKKTIQGTQDENSSKEDSSSKKTADVKRVASGNEAAIERKKLIEKEKDNGISVSLLKIQIGLIRKAWKHPSADSLLVEEIDVGETKPRQVVSILAKYFNPDDLMNRRVALITNVKPRKIRDVMSEGMVLCASDEDHTIEEPLIVPEGAKIGECVSFSGHEGKLEDILNPKKQQLDKITLNLYTDDKGVATFNGSPFMTSGGPCRSSIPKAIFLIIHAFDSTASH